MKKIEYKNLSANIIEIIVEPAAENFQLFPNQTVVFESVQERTFKITFDGESLIVFEEFGSTINFGETLKVYIDNIFVYPRR